jgi:antitoxin component YwqK of YwqJK toxin-antitoxin module/Tfp pilus assembly protein PilF
MRIYALLLIFCVFTTSPLLAYEKPRGYKWVDGKLVNSKTMEQANGRYEFRKHDNKFVQNYKDGVKDGEQLEYHGYTPHLKWKEHYSNGKKDGRQEYFYKNGDLRSVSFYEQDIQNGLGKSFYESGKILKEVLYIGGRQQYIKGYFENGQLKYEWVGDKKKKFITHFKEYDEAGNLMAKGQQYGPSLIGENYAYYPDGRVKLYVKVKGTTNKDAKVTKGIFYDSQGAAHPATNRMVGKFFEWNTAAIKDSWIEDHFKRCKDAACFIDAGVSYKKIKQTDRAIALFNEAIKLEPESAKGYKKRGDAYRSAKQYDRAIEDYNQALQIKPDYKDAYYTRGHAHKAIQAYENAIADYRETIRLNPKSYAANNLLAWLFATASNADYRNGSEAVKHALQATALKNKPRYLVTLGAAYVENNQYGKAVEAYESAFEKYGSKGVKRYQQYLQDKGYYQGAVNGEYDTDVREAMVACVNDGCKLGVN